MDDEKSIVFYFVVAVASKVYCIMLMLFMQRYFFGRLAIYFKKQCEMRYSQAEKPAEICFLFRR